MSKHKGFASHTNGGFTLIELLVVVAIIVLLAAMILPALTKVRDLAFRASCSSNERQHFIALRMYANDNESKLPQHGTLPWLWDMQVRTTDMMLKNGVTKDSFYCPANKQQQKYLDRYWEFYEGPDEENPERAGYRVTGYFWIVESSNRTTPIRIYDDELEKKWLWRLDFAGASNAELIADSTISQTSGYSTTYYPHGNFERITVGAMGTDPQFADVGFDRTSHLKDDREPTGSNIGFADGHVKWRSYNELNVRYPPGSGNPLHWW